MKLIVCESCDAEFSVRHYMDEIYFEILCCPFCGAAISDNSIPQNVQWVIL